MRSGMELVFDQVVRGTTEVSSAPTFNEFLRRGDAIAYEIEVEDASGTTPTISVRHYHSNSGKGFLPLSYMVNAASLASLPYRAMGEVSGTTLGSVGQVGVTLGGTTPTARVRIWACIRNQ